MVFLLHLLSGLSFGGLLFLVGSGLTLTFGLLRTVNLAHGAFYLLGGYVALSVGSSTGSYWAGLLAAVLVVGAGGMVYQRFVLSRLQGQELPQIVLSVGLALVIGDVIHAVWGANPVLPPRPPGLDTSLRVGGLAFPWFRLALVGMAVAVAAVIELVLSRTRVGATVRAAVDDEVTARSVGIRVPFLFLCTFGIGAGLAAFAGVWGGAFTGLAPDGGFDILLLALVVVVVGGLGSVRGALVAALLVGLVDEAGKWLFPSLSLFTVYAPVVVFLALRPNGLFGRVELAKHSATDVLTGGSSTRGVHLSLGLFGVGAALLVLVLAPLVLDDFSIFILNSVVVMGLFAVAFNVVFGYGGMSSLGHAALFGVGSYAVVLGQVRFGWHPLLAGAVGVVAAGMMGLLLGVLTARTRGVYVLLLTVAAAQAVWGLVLGQVGFTGGDTGISNIPVPFGLGRVGFYRLSLAATVLCMVLLRLFVVSPVGVAIVGLRESESRMAALGYSAGRYRVAAFTVSGLFSGVAGCLSAWMFESINPQAVHWTLSAAVMVHAILGGAGTFLGPFGGAAVLIGLETWVSSYTERWPFAIGLVYMLTVLFLPGGLASFGRRLLAILGVDSAKRPVTVEAKPTERSVESPVERRPS